MERFAEIRVGRHVLRSHPRQIRFGSQDSSNIEVDVQSTFAVSAGFEGQVPLLGKESCSVKLFKFLART